MADNPTELTVETALDTSMDEKSPSNSSVEAADTRSIGSPTAQSENGPVMSPRPAETQESYSTDLIRAFPKVCQKAKSGVQLCQAVSAFVTERASTESGYAQSLLKLAQSAKAEDWSEQLTDCWATFQEATEHLAQERWAFATTLQTSIVPGAKAFAAQQEVQVQRLITEGTKVRWAQVQMTTTMEKAREKYERKCQEAAEITASMRKSESGDANTASSTLSPDSSPDEVSSSKELTDKLAAGAGQLLTKMWDTTSSFGRSSLERQRSKLYSSLEEVIAAEKHYAQTVEYTNAQRLIFEREIKENLRAFQLTEEQRLEYLKDVLMRMQKAFIGMFSRSQQFVERMKESANNIDELADIEKGFQSLGQQGDVDVDQTDLATNPFYFRLMHAQAMSDNGQRMIGVINAVVMEFITSESRFSQSLRKLLRTHKNGGTAPPSDLFGTGSSNVHGNFLADEGATMANGWMTVRDQVKLLLEVHQEFQSLLAEPVSLSLSTMKSEYESVRTSTQESFTKTHSTLCNESATHKKLQHKLEVKSRDFTATYSHVSGAPAIPNSTSGVDVGQALKSLATTARLPNEKDRRLEAKLQQLAEEIRQLQTKVAESSRSLKQNYQVYVQEIEVFISTYMKNEKYRLQVSKNSLQSMAKAIEHMLHSGASVGSKAQTEFEKIDATNDIAEFIRINRQPYERTKRIVPAYHGNDSLKEVMREYLASVGAASSMTSENTPKSPSSTTYTSASAVPVGELSSPRNQPLRDATSPKMGEQKAPPHGSFDLDEDDPDEGNSTTSGMDLDEDDSDAQSLGVSDFQKKFKLDVPEQIVESYSCALYLTNFPFHGRLYLTRNRMCFSGWRDTIFVASFADISTMEKKNTALIVPNAIEFTVKDEKVFFTSFVFRDECFQSIQQLRSIKKETEALLSESTKQLGNGSEAIESPNLTEGGKARRRRSSSDIAAVAPVPKPAAGSSTPTAATPPTAMVDNRTPSFLSVDVPSPTEPTVPEKDLLLSEYDLLLDEEVMFSVDDAYSKLWVGSDVFARGLLEAGGSTNIAMGSWERKPFTYTAVTKPDSFDASRTVTYTHNKKYMVGPSVIPTSQTQRYAYTFSSRLVISTTTCVSDVPYCDYFRVENRWVFSATKKSGVCLAQVGVRVQWLKSTWLKKQIEGTTVSEAKESVKTWLSAAIAAAKPSTGMDHAGSGITSTNADAIKDGELGKSSKEQVGVSTPSTNLASTTSLTRSTPTASMTQSAHLHPTMQVAIIVCAVMFIYTMYRVCTAMDQMQAMTREALLQQQQQQAFLKELLEKLGSTRN